MGRFRSNRREAFNSVDGEVAVEDITELSGWTIEVDGSILSDGTGG